MLYARALTALTSERHPVEREKTTTRKMSNFGVFGVILKGPCTHFVVPYRDAMLFDEIGPKTTI